MTVDNLLPVEGQDGRILVRALQEVLFGVNPDHSTRKETKMPILVIEAGTPKRCSIKLPQEGSKTVKWSQISNNRSEFFKNEKRWRHRLCEGRIAKQRHQATHS